MITLDTARGLLSKGAALADDDLAAVYVTVDFPPAQAALHAMFVGLARRYPSNTVGLAVIYARANHLAAIKPVDLPARAMSAVDYLRSGDLLGNTMMQGLLESAAGNFDRTLAIHAMLVAFAEAFAAIGSGEKASG